MSSCSILFTVLFAILQEAIERNWPIYVETPEGVNDVRVDPLENLDVGKRSGLGKKMWSKRGNKLLRLSLTNNIDVLREKLFMEIARRNRLASQNQVIPINTV